MSGQHHFVLNPKKSLFRGLLAQTGDRLDKLASELQVSPGTVSKLINGSPVTPRIIQQIASELNLSASQLIEEDSETLIPTDPSAIRSLKWGWFIDNDRFRGGAPRWFWERIEWDAKSFSGRIQNLHETEYHFTAQRVSDRLLTLTATESNNLFAFISSFTHYFPHHKAMTGIWAGMNDLGIPSVYRMFMSESELSLETLQEISMLAKIDTVFVANTLQLQGEKSSTKALEHMKKS